MTSKQELPFIGRTAFLIPYNIVVKLKNIKSIYLHVKESDRALEGLLRCPLADTYFGFVATDSGKG